MEGYYILWNSKWHIGIKGKIAIKTGEFSPVLLYNDIHVRRGVTKDEKKIVYIIVRDHVAGNE